MLAAGASPRTVMKTLGHSQIGLTMNTYTHVLPEIEREAIDAAARSISSDRQRSDAGLGCTPGCTPGCTEACTARTQAREIVLDLGAGERIRTAGLPFTRRLLCLLSYTGEGLGAW